MNCSEETVAFFSVAQTKSVRRRRAVARFYKYTPTYECSTSVRKKKKLRIWCQQPIAGHLSLWLGLFLYKALNLRWIMLHYWNHILLTKAHFVFSLFCFPSSLFLSVLPSPKWDATGWLSILGGVLYINSQSWWRALCIERSAFNFWIIIAFTNIIRNPPLTIMDLYSIAGSHLSHQVTSPGLLEILDNIIFPAHAIVIFLQHTLGMISKYTGARACTNTVIKDLCTHTVTHTCQYTRNTQHTLQYICESNEQLTQIGSFSTDWLFEIYSRLIY